MKGSNPTEIFFLWTEPQPQLIEDCWVNVSDLKALQGLDFEDELDQMDVEADGRAEVEVEVDYQMFQSREGWNIRELGEKGSALCAEKICLYFQTLDTAGLEVGLQCSLQ